MKSKSKISAVLIAFLFFGLSSCSTSWRTPTSVGLPPAPLPSLPPPKVTPAPEILGRLSTPPLLPPKVTPVPEVIPVTDTPYVLYFYFVPQGCGYCNATAPVIERFYQEHGTTFASLDGENTRLAALERLLVAGDEISFSDGSFQIVQESKRKVEVKGVPIHSWGVDEFKSSTGITFPIVRDPGLSVDTSRHPVTVVYNKQTSVMRVAAVGGVSYSTLVNKTDSIIAGRSTPASRGGY